MDWETHSNYKWTNKSQSRAEQVCYCCGLPAMAVVHADGFPGNAQIGVCMLCAGGQFIYKEGYLVYDCPSCGSADIKGMIDYWKALAKHNKEHGTKLTGKRVSRDVDWIQERHLLDSV